MVQLGRQAGRIDTHWNEILVLVLVFLACVASALSWLHLSSQSTIPRSYRTAATIILRLLGIISVCFVMACIVLKIPVYIFVAGVSIVLLIAPLATHHGVGGSDAFEFALVNCALLPIYVVKQFVLGFPDRDVLFLAPPSSRMTPTEELSPLNACVGTVVGTLRPCGTVMIGKTVYSATSADGQYVDSGTSIRVTGSRDTMLVVMAINAVESDTA